MNIPNKVAYNIDITPHARILYGHMNSNNQYFTATTKQLQVKFSVGFSSITNWLRELEKADLIRWQRGTRLSPLHIIYINGHIKEKAL